MKIITIEEHYADQRIIDATAKYGDPSYMTALPDKVRGAYNHMRFTGEKLTDVDTVRFDFMREQKVDVQVLSYTNPVPDTVPSEEAVKICREANDILADMVKKHPDRFAAFATLPMADSTAAAKELERCVKEYDFVGALITGTYQGKFYDDPMFSPIFRAVHRSGLVSHLWYYPALSTSLISPYCFISFADNGMGSNKSEWFSYQSFSLLRIIRFIFLIPLIPLPVQLIPLCLHLCATTRSLLFSP